MESDKVINQWDNIARNYADNQRTAKNNLTNWQIIKDVLGDIENKKILDAGCGDGFFTNELLKLKAKICGCDGSKNLISIARQDFKNIDFDICDLTKPLPYKQGQFDIVVSSLTLMDIDELDCFFSEAYRVLKRNGKLVFSIVHPCFFQAEWEKDQNGEKLYKKVVNYYRLDKEILNFWGESTHYHRPLTWYCDLFKRHNFVIEQILENPRNVETFEDIKPHQRRVPLFICFSLIKK